MKTSSDDFFAGLPIVFAGFLPTVCHLAAVALASLKLMGSGLDDEMEMLKGTAR